MRWWSKKGKRPLVVGPADPDRALSSFYGGTGGNQFVKDWKVVNFLFPK